MKLDKFSELSRGKKILAILGLNIIMITVYTLLLAGNVTAIFSGVLDGPTLKSGFSVFINVCIIFTKYVVFLISFIVINVLLIKNKLKAAIIIFLVIVLSTVVIGAMQSSEYNQLTEDVSEFVNTYDDILSDV